MGINPTPTNHRSFTFDGKSTREFGVYITGKDVFNSPERAVEMISIPGRDGEYALDQGHFNNIEVTYRAGIVADSTTDFAEAISNFRNWLASREGYCRLTDEYNTEEYRMAVFKNAIALEHEGLLTGEFDVTFDCKPQRYLAIGEELTEIGAWGNTETAEGEVVTIEASSDTAVKALTADISPIQDLHGYDAPWVGGSHYNKWDEEWEVGFIDPNSGQNSSQYSTMIRSKNYIPCSPNTAYFFKASANASNGMFFYDSSKNYLSKDFPSKDTVFTTPNNAYYIRFCMAVAYGTTYKNDIAINYPSTVTTYSPYENICPISGHDDVDVYDDPLYAGFIKWNQLTVAPTRPSGSFAGMTYTNNTDGTFTINGTANATDYYTICVNSGTPNPTHKYLIGGCATNGSGNYWIGFGGSHHDDSGNGAIIVNPARNNLNITFSFQSGVSFNNAVFTPQLFDLTEMFGAGNEPSTVEEFRALFPLDYYAYNSGTTTCVSAVNNLPYGHYTTTLPSTTYGGTVDVVSGTLKPAPYYASYNGEALEGEWVSDRDKYVAGTTPTTGAQVVNIGKVGTATQLTGQSVELLEGENNIFADSGQVTVEYGHNPTLLTNPTWFPSKPLLAVDGYGEIKFNNRSIAKLENVTIGNVQVAQSQTGNDPLSVTINSDLLNTSDEFVVSGAEVYLDYTHNQLGSFYGGITINSVTNGTAITNDITSRKITVVIKPNDITFTKGTSASTTVTVDHTIHYIVGGTQGTIDETAEAVIAYDGDKTISYSVTLTPALVSNFIGVKYRELSPDIYGQSSISALGNPTYIDCEAGECYMVNSADEVVSLNNNIDLGSDLPELQSGDTEVTYDNTITKVEVKPNWWKV